MYQDPYFKDKDPSAIRKFVEEHPLALLSGCDKQYRPVATHVPVMCEEQEGRWCFRGHMIRGSGHHRAFEENPQVMMVFSGPQSYVSATWYKEIGHASTWNYMSVQATGKIRFLGEGTLREIMQETTLHFEKGKADSPTVFNNLDTAYTDRLLDYIVAFEVEADAVDHIFKLSQDKDAESFDNIVRQLRKGDPNARMLAEEMEKRRECLSGIKG